MSNQEIRDLYDSRPNMTLGQLSALSGLPVAKLKKILFHK